MGALNTFPVSLKVQNRRIVIVGGGDEALNKARLAVKTSADVIIVTRAVAVDFSGLPVTLIARTFDALDLEGAAMVFVADHGPDGAAAKIAARQAGVPLNVVDVPHECDFFTPAIIDRAPLSIAISSEGDAPVLARLVRAKIEALLSPNLGPLAKLAGSLRERVSAILPAGPRRRRYYEELVTSPAVESALDLGVSDAWREAVGLLDRHAAADDEAGIVWLIGAGPGAEDLLTLRAQRLLQQADVIVHDQLVPDAVVEMGRRDAERVKVGKAKGHHSFTQAQINALLVRLAREGKKVARLKSGDPMIFGRAGEEIAALRKADIAYAIVPGITSALAAAADSATPVTLRKVASGFVVATAHGADNAELQHWVTLARQGITLGLYMGKSIAADIAGKLIKAGLEANTPVGVVVNAGRADKQLYAGSLEDLRLDTFELVDGPAIILIGEAVSRGDWADAVPLVEQQVRVA